MVLLKFYLLFRFYQSDPLESQYNSQYFLILPMLVCVVNLNSKFMNYKEECRTYRGTPRDILSDFQNRLSRKIRFRLKKIFVLRKIP